MARTRRQEGGTDWSCPMCTLLNSAEDDRCQACDNARPPSHLLKKSQPPDSPAVAAIASEAQCMYRPASGVFFSSSARPQGDSSTNSSWRQEPRLVVNRRRGVWRQKEAAERERDQERHREETGTAEQTAGSRATERREEQEVKAANAGGKTTDAVEPMVTAEQQEEEEQEEDEEEETAMEPCFNLLGTGASVFAAPVVEDDVEDAVEDQCATVKTKSREDSGEVDGDDDDDDDVVPVSPPPKYPGFMPASRVLIEEPLIEEKLASAGLDLSDSEDEEDKPKQLRRKNNGEQDDSWEDKWVCQICTNLNAQSSMECSSCMVKRYKDAPHGAKNPTGKDLECPVCTNLNPPGSKECNICETLLQPDASDDHFVDLSSSPPARKQSYSIDDGDLNNPYADLSQYNYYDDVQDAIADPDPDFVEGISDNEAMMSLNNTRPVTVRPELKEFKHFVCLEDLRSDYGCRINYNKMFAGQRSSKSYADRLAARTAESRKRKRNAARKAAGEATTPPPRSGKAARGSKKRKSAAASRRASSAGTKPPRAKRARKTAASGRRASSARTPSPGINHYDDTGADLGEGFSAMAWEGVGSAGYH
ncbi:Zinc finger, RanBP2-type [Phytophthora cinnamomi]|uniref:Zinc finger, RanBP2-type n=1 Tax=Phytophthora cinnamomi TaxID=4785 RepID=UPI00355A034B|nr:Zinc finger, RanBP2-type [Phytophthora cinnamomi]